MHGFLIHTTDQRLLVRNYDYIKYDNPGWWQENLHHVASFWEFNTEDAEGMKSIMFSLRRISEQKLIESTDVELFCQSVGFDLEKFKKDNATQHNYFAKVKGQNWDSSEKTSGGGFAMDPTAFQTLNNKKSE
jgi:hypothetical protein